ncbi:MAG: hypothetical protein H7039_24660 [Bryobacteraceae bacterium]|nr:hypothetical protein [Bryobacteraceae bacterium]
MKRLWIAGLLLAAFAIGGYLFRVQVQRRTPPGQVQLNEISVTSLDSFRQQFNRTSDSVRVIALLSPT